VENLKALPSRVIMMGLILLDRLAEAKAAKTLDDMRAGIDQAIENADAMLASARDAAADVEES
jgi:hypothetical protein